MKIAVDAMGGDYAPAVVMEAIQSVLKEIPDVEILLVGHKEKLSYYMEKMNLVPSDRLELVHAETVVEMSDPSTAAIRAKKNSSITRQWRRPKSKCAWWTALTVPASVPSCRI